MSNTTTKPAKLSRLTLAQNAYNTAQSTGWTANPYRYTDQRLSWLAHEIGIYFHNSGRTCPWDISGKGYSLEVNNIRFTVKVVTDADKNVTGISFERS